MAVLRCGYCGGDLDFNEDLAIGICQFCGSTNTIPKNIEKKQNLYNRATYLRQNKDFDKAIETYDRLLDEDNTDADAHWGLLLSKYGIEYVTDPYSKERIPTCHRIQSELIQNDLNYRAALQYAKGISARDVYKREAVRIAEIQKKYLEITRKEPNYDIFICYKETDDATHERTLDSTLAQDIYYELEKKGYNVFFARKTLEKRLGTEYEPIIFAALNSAKVMVTVGTKPEYLNAPWVKNEWSRYLQFAKDSDKSIIPAYRNMSPYDLPDELSTYQALDMSKIGFLQDLIDGIKKLTSKGSNISTYISGGVSLDALLSRGKMAIEDEQWEKANEFFEQVLNMDAENGEAYEGLLLLDQRAKNIDDIKNVRLQRTQNVKGKKLFVSVDTGNLVSDSIKKYSVDGYYDRSQIENRFAYDLSYVSITEERIKQYDDEISYWNNNSILKKVNRFGDDETKSKLNAISSGILEEMQKRISFAKKHDDENVRLKTNEYLNYLKSAQQNVLQDYESACKRAEKDQEVKILNRYDMVMKKYDNINPNNVKEICEAFEEIKGFYINAKFCTEQSDMKLDNKIDRCKNMEKSWKRRPLIVRSISFVSIAVLLGIAYFLCNGMSGTSLDESTLNTVIMGCIVIASTVIMSIFTEKKTGFFNICIGNTIIIIIIACIMSQEIPGSFEEWCSSVLVVFLISLFPSAVIWGVK